MTGRRVLVTNDDGIDATGLRVLAVEAVRAGLEVVVAAPGWDSSGASASFTAVEDEDGVGAVLRDFGLPDTTAFSVDASPAYIVRAGLAGAFGPRPDAVLSGVNLGANLGHAVLHSGTVGAALTAATLGYPALAASLATEGEPVDWEGTRRVLRQVIPMVLDHRERVVSVNIPAVAADDIRGIERASLATFGAVQVTNTERSGDRIKLTYSPWTAEEPEGSDADLISRCFATVTPLEAVCESSAPVDDMVGPLER